MLVVAGHWRLMPAVGGGVAGVSRRCGGGGGAHDAIDRFFRGAGVVVACALLRGGRSGVVWFLDLHPLVALLFVLAGFRAFVGLVADWWARVVGFASALRRWRLCVAVAEKRQQLWRRKAA